MLAAEQHMPGRVTLAFTRNPHRLSGDDRGRLCCNNKQEALREQCARSYLIQLQETPYRTILNRGGLPNPKVHPTEFRNSRDM